MTIAAFLDSGAFIAFLDRSDRCHEDVKALFSRPPRSWAASLLVVSETYSWMLHRLGEEPARTFLGLLESLPQLQILTPDAAHHAAVLKKLQALRGTKLTYVDASSLVWLQTKKIPKVWGTDHHLGVEGAAVVPGRVG